MIGKTSCVIAIVTIGGYCIWKSFYYNKRWKLPVKIILVRHGESLGNVAEHMYREVADWRIPLTEKGIQQAREAGKIIRDITEGEKIVMFYSPYQRTCKTMEEIAQCVKDDILLIQEEPRIREQDFGNFQKNDMSELKSDRSRFGRFFYRFPNGESGADVYDRVSTFLESMYRTMQRLILPRNQEYTVIIVSHGLTIRLFLMRWFRWTVQDFEKMQNPKNSSPIVLYRYNHHQFTLDADSWKALGVVEDQKPCLSRFQCPTRNGPTLFRCENGSYRETYRSESL